MSDRFFRINKNNTISLAFDELNPSEVQELIDNLKGHLFIMKQRKTSPQEVLTKTMRRSDRTIKFQFAWNGKVHEIDLDDPSGLMIPYPDVPMSDEDWEDARQFIFDCATAE